MSTKEDQRWMQLAISTARQACVDVPVGAVIIQGQEIVASAYNNREETQNPVGHAEILCLQQAAGKLGTWRLSNCCLYVTLEPCPMCAEALLQSRISKIVFGAYDSCSGALGSRFNLNTDRALPEPDIIGGICEDECKQLLQSFFQQNR